MHFGVPQQDQSGGVVWWWWLGGGGRTCGGDSRCLESCCINPRRCPQTPPPFCPLAGSWELTHAAQKCLSRVRGVGCGKDSTQYVFHNSGSTSLLACGVVAWGCRPVHVQAAQQVSWAELSQAFCTGPPAVLPGPLPNPPLLRALTPTSCILPGRCYTHPLSVDLLMLPEVSHAPSKGLSRI